MKSFPIYANSKEKSQLRIELRELGFNGDDVFDDILDRRVEQFSPIQEFLMVYIFDVGERIIQSEEPLKTMHLVLSGRAKTQLIHEDGKISIIGFIARDEFVGEMTLLEVEKVPKDVIAISTCITIGFPIKKVKEYLLKDASFLLEMSRYLARRYFKRSWFYAKSQNYELKYRLAAYILMAENNGIYKEKHTETAEYLGVSYRHLLYTFKNMIDDGILKKEKRIYRIDKEKLRLLAEDIMDENITEEETWENLKKSK